MSGLRFGELTVINEHHREKSGKSALSCKYIVSLSGGKDSTAMLLRLIAEEKPVDEIVFFDTGWEFPQMTEHVDLLEKNIGRGITRLHPEKSFEYWMIQHPVRNRKTKEVNRIGYGWPSAYRRWCTRIKIDTIDKYLSNDDIRYIGYAADEMHRMNTASALSKPYEFRYPLYEWGMTEQDCLEYCLERGYSWGGLYGIFRRVSCFCCPLQRIGELKKLRKHYPNLWQRMLDMEDRIKYPEGIQPGFKNYTTVHDYEERFADEDKQMSLEL